MVTTQDLWAKFATIIIVVNLAIILCIIAQKATTKVLVAHNWFIIDSLVLAYAMLVIASLFFCLLFLQINLHLSNYWQKNRKSIPTLSFYSSRQSSRRAEPQCMTTSWPGPSLLLFSRWSYLSLAHSFVRHLLLVCGQAIMADYFSQSPPASPTHSFLQ